MEEDGQHVPHGARKIKGHVIQTWTGRERAKEELHQRDDDERDEKKIFTKAAQKVRSDRARKVWTRNKHKDGVEL